MPASSNTARTPPPAITPVPSLAGRKSLGTTNPINMAKATVNGLKNLRRPEDVARARGLTISQVLPYKHPVVEESTVSTPAPSEETPSGESTEAAQPPVREADQGKGSGEPGGSPGG